MRAGGAGHSKLPTSAEGKMVSPLKMHLFVCKQRGKEQNYGIGARCVYRESCCCEPGLAEGAWWHQASVCRYIGVSKGMLTLHQGCSHEAKGNAVLPVCVQHSRPCTEPHVSSRQESEGWCWFIAPRCYPWVVLLQPSFFPLCPLLQSG